MRNWCLGICVPLLLFPLAFSVKAHLDEIHGRPRDVSALIIDDEIRDCTCIDPSDGWEESTVIPTPETVDDFCDVSGPSTPIASKSSPMPLPSPAPTPAQLSTPPTPHPPQQTPTPRSADQPVCPAWIRRMGVDPSTLPTPEPCQPDKVGSAVALLSCFVGARNRKILDSYDESISIQVFCQANRKEKSVAVSLPLPPNNSASVWLKGLTAHTAYTCLTKYVTNDTASRCSLPADFMTTNFKSNVIVWAGTVNPSDEPSEYTLRWFDGVRDNNSEYIVEAWRQEPQAACCKDRVDVLSFRTNNTCCTGLTKIIPAGSQFRLHVKRKNDREDQFGTTDYLQKPDTDPRVSDVQPYKEMSANGNMIVKVCPPCVDYKTTFPLFVVGFELRSGPVGCTDIPLSSSMADWRKYPQEDDDWYLVPIEVRNTFQLCGLQENNATISVRTVYDDYRVSLDFKIPDFCPPPPNMAAAHEMVDIVPVSDTAATVFFNQAVFPLFDGELPKWYSLIVAESGFERAQSEASDCQIDDSYIVTWTMSHALYHMASYRASPEQWNPFTGDNLVAQFPLGDEVDCPETTVDNWCNGPLRPNTIFALRIRAYAREGVFVETPPIKFSLSFSSNYSRQYIIVCIACMSIFALLSSCLVCKHLCRNCSRCKRAKKRQPTHSAQFVFELESGCRGRDGVLGDLTTGMPKPYSSCEFKALVMGMDQDMKCRRLQREFEALCALSSQCAARTPSRVGNLPQNSSKNRYSNIVPFDKNRVRLMSCSKDDDFANYINASYITGYSGRVEYIAAQGPKEETTKDFWFMVYEQNVRLVIMLTKLVENDKVKCHQYYPEVGERFMWGDLAVQCSVQSDLAAYTLRTIVMNKGAEERLVQHLHFREWPDFGRPASPKHVLDFCLTVRQHTKIFPGMMVVHCSAGVGRTGTLIAMDILLQRLQAKKSIDVLGIVLKLREQRTFMVQCHEQYIFLYQCLKATLEKPQKKTILPPCLIDSSLAAVGKGFQVMKKTIKW